MCSGQAAPPDFPHKRIQIQKQESKTVVALQSLQEAIMAETFVEFRTAFGTVRWLEQGSHTNVKLSKILSMYFVFLRL